MADLSPQQQQQYFGKPISNEYVQSEAARYQKDPFSALWDLITGKGLAGQMSSAQGGTLNPTRTANEAGALAASYSIPDIRNAAEMNSLYEAGARMGARASPYDIATADQSRGAQLALLAQMRAQAAGPSLAGMQGQQAMGQGLQAALRGAAMGQPGRAMMVGAGQQGAGMAADVARARLAEAMRAQAGMGGLAGGLRGSDIGIASTAAQIGLQSRAADDALRQFYASQGLNLANARANLEAERQKLYELEKLKREKRDIEIVRNFAGAGASMAGTAAGM